MRHAPRICASPVIQGFTTLRHLLLPRISASAAITKLLSRIRPVNPSFPLSTWSDTPLEMEPCASSTGARSGVSHDQEADWRRAFLAEDDREAARSGIRFGSLPAAPVKGESVLLVAAQAQGRSTGTDMRRQESTGSGELCAGRDEPEQRTPASSSCWGRTSAAHPQGRG